MARRRKQNNAWARPVRPAADDTRQRPRPATRRPALKRFRWTSLAWVGGGLAAVVATLALVIASATNHQGQAQPIPSVAGGVLVRGQPPPDFTATTFDGHQFTLSSLKGQPVLVNFFASWCTQCASELPFMEQSYKRHQAEGFVIVGVNGLETGDGVSFYHRYGLTFPAVHDPGNPGKISLAYNVTSGLPVSVFLDKTGRVDLIQLGALTPDLLEREIQKLS